MKRNILFLNDKTKLNKLYRSALMDYLKINGFKVSSIGLFDNNSSLFRSLLYLLCHPLINVVSSNLRTNCVVLLIVCLPGLVILNGMGRYRRFRLLRLYLLYMFVLNSRKAIAIQNYADYRYFRRYISMSARLRLFWVSGSGGTNRTFGKCLGVEIIQREDKLELVSDSVCNAMTLFSLKRIAVVGCNSSIKLQRMIPGAYGVGYVRQQDILSYGNIFLQPFGYGEGFPHSMSDALVSGMDVLITRKAYISYGLYKLRAPVVQCTGEWYRVSPNNELKAIINIDNITKCYYNLILCD